MIGLDTNVLLRYLVEDEPTQAKIATDFIEEYCSLDSPCFVGQIALCELVWVLESNYGQSRKQIGLIIEKLLRIGDLEIMKSDVVWKALHDYKLSNADFSDHLLARKNESVGCKTTVTFDVKASKQPAFTLLK